MATRCIIKFTQDNHVYARVYRHWDGYPDTEGGVLADLAKFFEDVEAETKDHRYRDAPYLAAKFVVWQARQNGEGLDFTGVGIVGSGDMGEEYVYTVDCSTLVCTPIEHVYKESLHEEVSIEGRVISAVEVSGHELKGPRTKRPKVTYQSV